MANYRYSTKNNNNNNNKNNNKEKVLITTSQKTFKQVVTQDIYIKIIVGK
jgi:hypothetical protein